MTEVTDSTPNAIFRTPYILSNRKQPAEIKGTRPTETEYGVLDPKTFDAVEVDALFEGMNHAETQIGQAVLYRSLAQPTHHVEQLHKKQEALRELAMNPPLLDACEQFIKKMADGEETLYHLLYGEFSGGFTTDHPKNRVGKLEFGGYGYRQFIDGTEFAVDLVEEAGELPPVQSAYLQELLQAIRDFGGSKTYALMHGPFYVIDGKFKTKDEKSPYLPIPRFRPSMFKWLPSLIFALIVSGLLYFFESMLVELGANYIGYGILIL
ncbi:MAG TPA: DNA mismatch repair protein MutS, partial [Nitrosomonas sp.]|nr:DNA mismatch repair protein MutS [Nitrosomonas sp.]